MTTVMIVKQYNNLEAVINEASDKSHKSVKSALSAILQEPTEKNIANLFYRLNEDSKGNSGFIDGLKNPALREMFDLLGDNMPAEPKLNTIAQTVRNRVAESLLGRLSGDLQSMDADSLKEVQDFLSSDRFEGLSGNIKDQLSGLKNEVEAKIAASSVNAAMGDVEEHGADGTSSGAEVIVENNEENNIFVGESKAAGEPVEGSAEGADGTPMDPHVDTGRNYTDIIDITNRLAAINDYNDLCAELETLPAYVVELVHDNAKDQEAKDEMFQLKSKIEDYAYFQCQNATIDEYNAPEFDYFYDILADSEKYKDVTRPEELGDALFYYDVNNRLYNANVNIALSTYKEFTEKWEKHVGILPDLDGTPDYELAILKYGKEIEKIIAQYPQLKYLLTDDGDEDKKASLIQLKKVILTSAVAKCALDNCDDYADSIFKDKLQEAATEYATCNSLQFNLFLEQHRDDIMQIYCEKTGETPEQLTERIKKLNNAEKTQFFNQEYLPIAMDYLKQNNVNLYDATNLSFLYAQNNFISRVAKKQNDSSRNRTLSRSEQLFQETAKKCYWPNLIRSSGKSMGISAGYNFGAMMAIGPLGPALISSLRLGKTLCTMDWKDKEAWKNAGMQVLTAGVSVGFVIAMASSGTLALGYLGSAMGQSVVQGATLVATKSAVNATIAGLSGAFTYFYKRRQLAAKRKELQQLLATKGGDAYRLMKPNFTVWDKLKYRTFNQDKLAIKHLVAQMEPGNEKKFFSALRKLAPRLSEKDLEDVIKLSGEIKQVAYQSTYTAGATALTIFFSGQAMDGNATDTPMPETPTPPVTPEPTVEIPSLTEPVQVADTAMNIGTHDIQPNDTLQAHQDTISVAQTDTLRTDNVQAADSTHVNQAALDDKLNAAVTQSNDSTGVASETVIEKPEPANQAPEQQIQTAPVGGSAQQTTENTASTDTHAATSAYPDGERLMNDKNLVFDENGKIVERFPMQNIDEFNKEVETKFADDKFTIHSFAKEPNNNYLLHMNDSSAYTISEFSDADKADIHYATQMSPTPVVEKLQAAGLWKEGHDRWDSEWTSAKVEQHLLELQNRTDLTPEQQAGFDEVMKYIHDKDHVNADNAAWRDAHPEQTHESALKTITPPEPAERPTAGQLTASQEVPHEIDTSKYDAARLYEEAKQRIHDKYTTEDGVKVIHDSQYGASKMIFKGRTLYAFDKDVDGDGKDDYLVGTVNVNDGHGNESTIYAVKASDGKQYLVDDKNNIHEVKNATKEINKIYKSTVRGRSDSY